MKIGGKLAIALLAVSLLFFIVPGVSAADYYVASQEDFDACVANSTSDDTIRCFPGEYNLTMGVPTNASIFPNNDYVVYEYIININLNGSAVGDEVATVFIQGFHIQNVTIAGGETALLGHVTLTLVDCQFQLDTASGWVGLCDPGGRAEGDLLNILVYQQTPTIPVWNYRAEELTGEWGIIGTFGSAGIGEYGFISNYTGIASLPPIIRINASNFDMDGCILGNLNLSINSADVSIMWNYFVDSVNWEEGSGGILGRSNYFYDMENGLAWTEAGYTTIAHIDAEGDGVSDYAWTEGYLTDSIPNMYKTGEVGTFTIYQSRYNTSYSQTPTYGSESGELKFTAYGIVTVKRSQDLELPCSIYLTNNPTCPLQVELFTWNDVIVIKGLPADSSVVIDFTLDSEVDNNGPPSDDVETGPAVIPPVVIPEPYATFIIWGLIVIVILTSLAAAKHEMDRRTGSGWGKPRW